MVEKTKSMTTGAGERWGLCAWLREKRLAGDADRLDARRNRIQLVLVFPREKHCLTNCSNSPTAHLTETRQPTLLLTLLNINAIFHLTVYING